MGTSCSKHETPPTAAAFSAEPAPTDGRRMEDCHPNPRLNQQQRARWSSSALLAYELNGGVPKSPLSAGYPKQPDALGGSSSWASREATLDVQGIPEASASGSSLRGSRCCQARNPLVRQHQTDHRTSPTDITVSAMPNHDALGTATATTIRSSMFLPMSVGCCADAKEMAEACAMMARFVVGPVVDAAALCAITEHASSHLRLFAPQRLLTTSNDDCAPPLCDTTVEPRDGPLDWLAAVAATPFTDDG